ncbi:MULTISPECIES: hypothetical protein [unclassified Microbacterium]|uniref:hypothetical protein n=1 Tax=unclassified Microbacterium TaxID=2609290 RepID=UPI003017473C
MTADTMTIVVSAIGVVLTLGTSFVAAGAWMVRRLDDRIDGLDRKLSTRIDAVASDVNDLKISIARLEGPPRQLLTASR